METLSALNYFVNREYYLRYNHSFRNLVEMMEERGLMVAHTTIMRWVLQYGLELDARIRPHLK